MKNKYFSFVALAAAALATSCASDDLAEQKQEQNQNNAQTVTLTASVNDVQTRVGMSKENSTTASFYWHSSDKILVQTKSSESSYSGSGAEFTIKDDDAKKDGATSATFTGIVASGSEVGTYAVYPYDSEKQQHSFTGEAALTYVFPASYTYNKVESNIFSKTTTTDGNSTTAYSSNPTNMPMLGTITTGDNDSKKISFKCLGGLAVIRFAKMPATSGTLTVTADQQLSGDYTVSDLSADNAQLTMATTTTDADKKVEFTFSDASTNDAGVFYLPLAVGTYTNMKVTIAYGDNNATTQTIDCGSVEITRAGVTAVSIETYSNNLVRTLLCSSNGTTYTYYYLGSNKYSINGYEFVDLGLDVLWATMNIGASKASDYGNYYAWGGTTAKTSFSQNDKASTFADAATNAWGSPCRMPTQSEAQALVNCGSTWNNNGRTFTSKIAGYTSMSIFLPAAGWYSVSNSSSTLKGDGNDGNYWTSTAYGNNQAYCFTSTNNKCQVFGADKWEGRSVRAVAPKP